MDAVAVDHIDVAVHWDSVSMLWRVHMKKAKVLGTDGEETSVPIEEGQYVTVTGTLVPSKERPAVEGTYVRMTAPH